MCPVVIRIAVRNFKLPAPLVVNKVMMGAGRAMSTPSQQAKASGECSYRCEFITGDSEYRKDSKLQFFICPTDKAENKAGTFPPNLIWCKS